MKLLFSLQLHRQTPLKKAQSAVVTMCTPRPLLAMPTYCVLVDGGANNSAHPNCTGISAPSVVTGWNLPCVRVCKNQLLSLARTAIKRPRFTAGLKSQKTVTQLSVQAQEIATFFVAIARFYLTHSNSNMVIGNFWRTMGSLVIDFVFKMI